MRSFIFSTLTGLAVCVAVLGTEAQAQAQRGRGGVGIYVGPSRYYGGGYGYNGYNRGYYGTRYYGGYPATSYYYPSTAYTYPSTAYTYPSTSYYYEPSQADRYYYYTSNGWRICKDRYTGEYWYQSGGTWYRWY